MTKKAETRKGELSLAEGDYKTTRRRCDSKMERLKTSLCVSTEGRESGKSLSGCCKSISKHRGRKSALERHSLAYIGDVLHRLTRCVRCLCQKCRCWAVDFAELHRVTWRTHLYCGYGRVTLTTSCTYRC